MRKHCNGSTKLPTSAVTEKRARLPAERFQLEALHSLPVITPDYRDTVEALVHKDLRLSFDSNRYCVPPRYVGRHLTIKADASALAQYVGGVTEVARAVFLRRKDLDVKRLVDYALRLNIGAVIRRLGFLLETSGIETPESVRALQSHLTPTYEPLDSSLPPEGPYQARWRVRVNVSPEELRAVAHT